MVKRLFLPMIVFLLTIIIGLNYLIKESWLGVIKGPFLPIEVVEIKAPLRYVTQEEVSEILVNNKIDKMGFFSLDMRKISSGLSNNPWIKDIKVARVWPNKLKVTFDEDEIMALFNQDYVLTKKTCKLVRLNIEEKDKIITNNLPLLVGDEKKVKKLCDTLAKMKNYVKPIGNRIKKLVISSRDSLYVELENNILVMLGTKNALERFRLFTNYYDRIKVRNKLRSKDADMKFVYFDMRYQNGLAVGKSKGMQLMEIMETA